jgi:hypothetical protein
MAAARSLTRSLTPFIELLRYVPLNWSPSNIASSVVLRKSYSSLSLPFSKAPDVDPILRSPYVSWMSKNSPCTRFACGAAMPLGAVDVTIPAISARRNPWKCAPRPSWWKGRSASVGELHTRLELVCAAAWSRCSRKSAANSIFLPAAAVDDPGRGGSPEADDTEIAFFEGEGLFLADVLAEQVLLAIPMKVICRSDCRGLCPHCGANLNTDECRCEAHAADSRLAPLARLKQDWFKKQ